MNVIILSSSPRYKGNSHFIYELSKRFSANNNVVTLSPFVRGTSSSEYIGNLHIERYKFIGSVYLENNAILPNARKNILIYLIIPFMILAQWFSLNNFVKNINADIINAHWLFPQGLVAVLYKKLHKKNIKVIITAHGSDVNCLNSIIFKYIKRFVINNADQIISVANHLKETLIKTVDVIKTPINIIPMGVDTCIFTPKREVNNNNNILFIGRLSQVKGINYLLDACEEIAKYISHFNLQIIGFGEDYDLIESRIKNSEILLKHCNMLGTIEHSKLPEYYNKADIVVLPSYELNTGEREGMPVVMMEALSCGTCFVGTDIPPVKEIIIDGINGFIVPQKNSMALASKIIYLLNNTDIIEKVRTEAIKTAKKHFDWDIIAKEYQTIFNNVL